VKTRITKWGNSLAVRIPVNAADVAELKQGQTVELAVVGPGELAIRAIRRKPTLKELVAQITKENRHEETDWGGPVGAEVW
jgi:antitoxin MazE